MDIDLIEVWPKHLDYPLHRQWLKTNRNRFRKVIVVFTEMNVPILDYRGFVQEAMNKSDITFLDCLPAKSGEDWRNKAVNMALTVSNAEWVWFTEQDFTSTEGFWDEIERLGWEHDAIGINEGSRTHPASLLVKRNLINETSRNFGVIPDIADHFAQFTSELGTVAFISPEYWNHMNGLSQNMRMLQQGGEPNYRPRSFKEYCKECLKVEPLHPDFEELFRWYTGEEDEDII